MSDAPLLLIHGGLGDAMNAATFWEMPGIAPGLRCAGFAVMAPDRSTTPDSWAAAARQLAGSMTTPSTVIAGSNGVSVAVRLALDRPELVTRLVLLWPATAGDAGVDAETPESARHLLAGERLRGVADAELATLSVPTAVVASDPPNRAHAAVTVERLAQLVPDARRHPTGFPESPHPAFGDRLQPFLDALISLLGKRQS